MAGVRRPTDPLFPYQWFFENNGQAGGVAGNDTDALRVWPD